MEPPALFFFFFFPLASVSVGKSASRSKANVSASVNNYLELYFDRSLKDESTLTAPIAI